MISIFFRQIYGVERLTMWNIQLQFFKSYTRTSDLVFRLLFIYHHFFCQLLVQLLGNLQALLRAIVLQWTICFWKICCEILGWEPARLRVQLYCASSPYIFYLSPLLCSDLPCFCRGEILLLQLLYLEILSEAVYPVL